jgi:hypothetical protein
MVVEGDGPLHLRVKRFTLCRMSKEGRKMGTDLRNYVVLQYTGLWPHDFPGQDPPVKALAGMVDTELGHRMWVNPYPMDVPIEEAEILIASHSCENPIESILFDFWEALGKAKGFSPCCVLHKERDSSGEYWIGDYIHAQGAKLMVRPLKQLDPNSERSHFLRLLHPIREDGPRSTSRVVPDHHNLTPNMRQEEKPPVSHNKRDIRDEKGYEADTF